MSDKLAVPKYREFALFVAPEIVDKNFRKTRRCKRRCENRKQFRSGMEPEVAESIQWVRLGLRDSNFCGTGLSCGERIL
jgi:hypothetical protein